MCDFLTPILGAAAAGGTATTAAGSAAAAGTAANILQSIGLATSIAGTIGTMRSQSAAFKAQASALGQQSQTEAQQNIIEDHRTRSAMESQLGRQRGELIARNIDMSSPTAVRLGVSAARELAFASQRVRSEGQARQIELSSQRTILNSRRATSRLRGITTVADTVLTSAPNIWPELLG